MNILLIFLAGLWIQDSLENKLISTYMRDSTKLAFEEYYIEYKGTKGLVHDIEVRNIDDLMAKSEKSAEQEVIHKIVKDSVFKGSLEETGGLIPEIDIPIPIPKVLGIGEGANIKISGSQDISFGVRKDLYKDPTEVTEKASNLPQFEMNQKLRVNTTGTIGRKIKVILDHDSEREAQYKNTVKLQYQGDEDEIIQLIEAGNTKFDLGGSAGAGGKGLFGIKGVAQLGPLSLEGVLSREQGQAKKITKSPTFAKEDTLSDENFVRGVFFKIPVPPGEIIDTLWVFYDDANYDDKNGKNRAFLFLHPQNPDSFVDTLAFFKLLEYKADWDFISIYKDRIQLFSQTIEGNKQLAVAYVTKSGLKVGSFGDTTNPDTLLLVRMRGIKDYTDSTWWNELRNVYYLGTNVEYVKIYRSTTSEQLLSYDENNRNIMQALGLDNDGDGNIDGIININDQDFKPLQGPYLIFPQEIPFATDSLSPRDTIIYMYSDDQYNNYQNEGYGKYKIVFKSQRREDKIQLGPGILEGSERITFGGDLWQRGKDYQIDYTIGELTILNSSYFNEVTKNLEIDYEVGQILQLKQRSLLGLKANYDMGKFLTMENIFVMRMESSVDKRPRLGEEPIRMGQYTMNLKSVFNPNVLTEWADKLPIVKTDKESEIEFNVTYNQSFPNPNIYGTAYIDDMESTEQSFELPISYRWWQRGAPPPGYSLNKLCKKLIWSTRSDTVKKRDINPDIPKEEQNDPVSAMLVTFRPLNGDPDEWASLHTLISPEGFDFSKYDYIEVIIKGNKGLFGIDLATSMNENSFWRDKNDSLRGDPNKIESEDINPPNGQLEADEDIGLDGVEGKDSENKPGDDGNDDWGDDAEHVNGTELNGRLDREDLDGDNRVNEPDNLVEYIIDLENDVPDYTSPSNFKIYRIYLRDTSDIDTVVGEPDFKKIKFARIWFSNFTEEDTVIIVSIKVVGNRYIKDGIFMAGKKKIPVDTLTEKFAVTTYNNKDHGTIYDPPPIKLYRDAQTGNIEREASLVLKFENLKHTHFARATRLNYKPENLLADYRSMKFWVKVNELSTSQLKYLVLRFYSGNDTMNYYEFRCTPPSGSWVNIEIDPLKFLETKKIRPEQELERIYQNPYEPSYLVKGNPNLQNVSRYSFGILNLTGENITGEVWIDEFRAGKPLRKSAHKLNTFFKTRVADLLTLNLRYENFQADFRDLNYQPGTGIISNSTHHLYDFSSSLSLNKFIPTEGFNIPLTFGYKRTFEFPKYMPASDIILSPSESRDQKSDQMERSISLNFSKSGSKNKILQYTLDRWTFTVLRSENYKKDPLNLDTLKSFNARTGYSLAIPFRGFKIIGQEINPFPSNIGTSFKYTSSRQKRYSFQDTSYVMDTNIKNLTGNSNYSISFRPLRSINLDYSSTQNYDLKRKKITGRWWGEINNYSQNFSLGYRPVLPSIFKILINSFSFTYNGNFNASKNTNVSDTVVKIPWSTISSSGSYNVQGIVDITGVINKIISWTKPEAKEGFKVLRSINPVNLGYTKTLQSTYYDLTNLPGYPYRFGFKHEIPFDSTSPYATGNTITDMRNFNASTGFTIDIFDFNTSYQNTDRITKPFNSPPTKTNTLEFPSLTVNIASLHMKFPGLKKFLSSLSFQSGYTRQREKSETFTSVSTNNSNNFSPLFNFQGRLRSGIGFNLSYSYNKSRGENRTQTASLKTRGDTKTIMGSVDFSYSNPKGIKLPFMKGSILKLKSQLNVTLRLSITENNQTTGNVTNHNQSQNFTIDLNYALTKDITGSGSIQYVKNIDKVRKVETGDLRMLVGVSFKF